ncbi:CNNM domain-containing protein [Craterilacuibacter sp. RT1T]|uniref:HlyC/CorC family transporter n=1 Tax=Craterilacuibacter sp. RT1T TaxID=2942211 RepID=UPI0020BD6B30|nr:CNNM domain-containing protein [Craterilacuibacter sp. RT1T]MCL6263618.1 CNNM domain-containing protein [Craterilacuibacter sp. RT1T]
MNDIPLSILFLTLVILLAISAFFSMSETGMMAANRFRLKSLAAAGNKGARRALSLLEQTDKLLGVILLGNNFVNSAAASLSTVIVFRLVGQNELALGLATLAVTFAILVFSEATPKILAAAHALKVASAVSGPLALLLKLLYPLVWFVNLFVQGVLKLLRVNVSHDSGQISADELRLLALESTRFTQSKHRSMLVNLFELEGFTAEDVMVPRRHIEAVDLAEPLEETLVKLQTCHHSRILVCENGLENLIGILHVRKVLHMMREGLTRESLREVAREPYFVPASTPLFTQLQNFQENRRRIGVVVDEYGELMGLVTMEDILEVVVGEFTTQSPEQATLVTRERDGSLLVDASMALRDLNRQFTLALPLSGPKTLNGLLIEHYGDIPDVGTCCKRYGCVFEILQIGERAIRRVRLSKA